MAEIGGLESKMLSVSIDSNSDSPTEELKPSLVGLSDDILSCILDYVIRRESSFQRLLG